jgi:hypothetical protein
MPMDEPIPPEIEPPESHRCAVCGERAAYGFGPPGGISQPAEGWYCGGHREEGEQAWAARYRGSSLGPAVLL